MAASDEVQKREQEVRQHLAANVRYYRRKRGLTQAQLAVELGISFVTLRVIERGTHSPSFRLFVALGVALDVTPRDLLRAREMAERRPGRPKR